MDLHLYVLNSGRLRREDECSNNDWTMTGCLLFHQHGPLSNSSMLAFRAQERAAVSILINSPAELKTDLMIGN